MDRRDDRRFDEVDRTADPGAFVRFLDRASGSAAVQAYKRRTFELLRVAAGARVLDVGCGTGEDAQALAALVGPAGRVVGVDNSATMITEARARAGNTSPGVAFQIGDAYALAFPDGAFDGCRADRVLHHLDEPLRALREMVRVTRAGGRIVVHLTDLDALSLAATDRSVTRRVVHFACDQRRNGWIARETVGMFRAAGLSEPEAYPAPLVALDLSSAMISFQGWAEQAAGAGVVSADEATAWWADLQQRDAEGRFFMVYPSLTIAATRP
jgi:ubiquinone/menaquinone biosynthesis C-methylase UbiE